MEKVVNSVKQIIDECNRLIEISDGSEFVDVKSLAKTLNTVTGELSDLFENSPEDTEAIRAKKREVEHTAIRFEFLLAIRHNECVERYQLRQYSLRLYSDARNKLLSLASDSDNKMELEEWGDRARWALKFYERSTHVIFETDEEDENKIRDIIEALRK